MLNMKKRIPITTSIVCSASVRGTFCLIEDMTKSFLWIFMFQVALGLKRSEWKLLTELVTRLQEDEGFKAAVIPCGQFPLAKALSRYLLMVSSDCRPKVGNNTGAEIHLSLALLTKDQLCKKAMQYTNKYQLLLAYDPSMERLANCPLRIDANVLIFEFKTFEIQASEVYKITPEAPLTKTMVASYSRLRGFSKSKDHKWTRRSQLNGLQFVVGIIHYKPFVTIEDGSITGLSMEIIQRLQRSLNFSISFRKFEFHEYDLLVNETGKDRVQLAIPGVSMSYYRYLILDMSQPLLDSHYGLFYTVKKGGINWEAYVKPFRDELWLSLVVYNVIVAAFFFAMVSVVSWPSRPSFSTLEMAGLFSYTTLLGKKFAVDLSQDSGRLIVLLVSFAGFVFINLYKAMLGASLAIKIYHPPFSSLEEILDSSHQILVTQNGYSQKLFEMSAPDTIIHNLWINSVKPSGRSYLESVTGMTNGTFNDVLLCSSWLPMTLLPQWPCTINQKDIHLSKDYFVFGFPRNWAYTELFNYHLSRMRETGEIDRLKRRYFPRLHLRCATNEVQPADLQDTLSIATLLMMGLVFTIFVLAIECFMSKNKK